MSFFINRLRQLNRYLAHNMMNMEIELEPLI